MTNIVNKVQKTLSKNVGIKPALDKIYRWRNQVAINGIYSDNCILDI